jgi:hypothetical protein
MSFGRRAVAARRHVAYRPSAALAGIIGGWREWTALMISLGSIPCRYVEVVPRSLCPELALNDVNRHPLSGELDHVCLPQLVRREAPPDTGPCGEGAELTASGRRWPRATACRTVDEAEQRGLLDAWWVSRVSHPLVVRRTP